MFAQTATAGRLPQTDNTDSEPLASLREDLQLLPAPRQRDGSPCWTIYDPVRHQFFRIGWLEFEIINRWRLGSAERIVEGVNRETTLAIDINNITEIYRFLLSNQLLQGKTSVFLGRIASSKTKIFSLFQNSLYQRFSLLRPDSFLEATVSAVGYWFSPLFWKIILLFGVIGGYLTLQKWDSFLQTFVYLFSLEGIIAFSVALIIVKFGHELAHAYTAKRFGLKVPSMGVAFILFWPIFFTDTTDAWKLNERDKRFKIGVAGVAFELAIAACATLLWNFSPPGPMKGVMFLLATTTWLATLAINLNPFMRYDGYYLLSDVLDVPNMQQRAFVLGRWFLRRLFLGFSDPCPERVLSFKKRTILLIYGYATWVYRLVLFTGIAVVVYHLFFKALGIVFFVGEITVLVAMPIFREVKTWSFLRKHMRLTANIVISWLMLFGLVMLFFYPWSSYVEAPSVYKAENHAAVFSPLNARIEQVMITRGQHVKKGEGLILLTSPELDYQEKQAKSEIEYLQILLKRSSFAKKRAENIQVVQQQLVEALTVLEGLEKQKKKLFITSPVDGKIEDMAESLIVDRWVNEHERLVRIVDQATRSVEGYIAEGDLKRVKPGNIGRFYPVNSEQPVFEVKVEKIAPSHEEILESPYFASVYGGGLPVKSIDKKLVVQEAVYKITMIPDSNGPVNEKVLRGTTKIRSKPVSLASKAWQSIAEVLIRESDF